MEILDTWCELEKPVLFGKQILTQPFFYQNLTNRKTLDIVSSHNDNNLYLLLEGNIKVKLDYSSVSTLDYHDTSIFILMKRIYREYYITLFIVLHIHFNLK